MGNGSSISINSIVKTHIFSNHISAFLYKNKSQGTFNNMSGYNNSYEDDELSCKTIRPSRLCYHLTNEGMIKNLFIPIEKDNKIWISYFESIKGDL